MYGFLITGSLGNQFVNEANEVGTKTVPGELPHCANARKGNNLLPNNDLVTSISVAIEKPMSVLVVLVLHSHEQCSTYNEELTELGLVEVTPRRALGVHDRKSRIRDKREPTKPKIGISLQGGGPETFRILSDLPSNED